MQKVWVGMYLLIAKKKLVHLPQAPIFADIAKNYQAALVYEPAMTPCGTLAKNRRGSGKFTLIATGKAAHVGRAFDEGRTAICYLAEAICAIHKLNDQRDGVTINVGKIAGGDALNMVPDKAVAKLDVRMSKNEDELWITQELTKIINELARKDYLLTPRLIWQTCQKSGPSTERLFQTYNLSVRSWAYL